MIIFHNGRPSFEFFNQTEEERMEILNPTYTQVNIFIEENVEKGSTVLFFDLNFFIFGQPYLYPDILCREIKYVNDPHLFEYLSTYNINYVFINKQPDHLYTNYPSYFIKNITLNNEIYLLKVNSSML